MRPPLIQILTAAVALAIGGNALALPGTIKSTRPYLYATQTELDLLAGQLPAGPLPPKRGTLKFTIKPALKAAGDTPDGVLFGAPAGASDAMQVRHIDSYDAETNQQQVVLQVGFSKPGATSYSAVTRVRLQPNVESTISISYDTVLKTVSVTATAGTVETVGYPLGAFNWVPGNQRFLATARSGDVVTNMSMTSKQDDGTAKLEWSHPKIDYELGRSRDAFTNGVLTTTSKIAGCPVTPNPVVNAESVCDVATAGRNVILETAKNLALASRLSGDPAFATAALRYVDMILAIKDHQPWGLAAGTEWSMNARIGALGVLYDWFYNDLGADRRQLMRSAIVQTIRTDIPPYPGPGPAPADYPNSSFDLIEMICGTKVGVTTGATLDCKGTPDTQRAYVTGHHFSAQSGTALGLLAIAQDSAAIDKVDVMPMIDRLYTHLVSGIIPARDYISVDGGHHSLFAYGLSGETIERLIVWRRALNAASGQIAPTKYEAKVIKPYIYGLRADNNFPATGDNFDLTVSERNIGYMALAAATAGDSVAAGFYEKEVKGRRSGSSTQVWERLMFPGARPAPAPSNTLALSAHFKVAGNVFMRDSWDYATSTLLDFKSSSFISTNHHHMDQNSFSVFRHKPLLLDTGAYDSYGSTHWDNYYRRTIAHNSIIVFDKDEAFTGSLSNDGGQWLKPNLHTYPTLAEIQPGGSHALDGVTHYYDGGRYAFVTGNASKAYSAKLNQTDGFLRSIVYLRPARPQDRTSIVVFDRVHTSKLLAATSLLHTATEPESEALRAISASTPGRIGLRATANNQPLLVRNGKGLMTIEPLLPKSAQITLVGGTDGYECPQVMSDAKQTVVPKDCRFLAPVVNGGDVVWTNFAPNTKIDKSTRDDFGAWRIEITGVPADKAPASTNQYFLNALHVDDDDPFARPASENSSKLLDSSDDSAAAVEVAPNTLVVFAKSSLPAQSVRWKAAQNWSGTLLVAGLKPSTIYAKSYDTNREEIVYTATGTGTGPSATNAQGLLDVVLP